MRRPEVAKLIEKLRNVDSIFTIRARYSSYRDGIVIMFTRGKYRRINTVVLDFVEGPHVDGLIRSILGDHEWAYEKTNGTGKWK